MVSYPPMPTFDPAYEPLLRDAPLSPLDAGTPDESARPLLATLPRDARAAGLWLRFNFLDESHAISQALDTPDGSFWHAILHRREGDFGNSKYWFRRVGVHPVYEPLRAEAATLAASATGKAAFLAAQTRWDPFAFVDLVAGSLDPKTAEHELCLQVQRIEWELLFAWCCANTVRR